MHRSERTPSLTRSFLAVAFGGAFCVLATAAMDREWPGYPPRVWLIFIAGLAVIAVVGHVAESYVWNRKHRSEDMTGSSAGHSAHHGTDHTAL